MTGTLYLCATPIGNLEDITFRVLRTLKEVDLIAAEDTRNSIKLLNHFEIKTPMTSYHELNKIDKAYQLVATLKPRGEYVLVICGRNVAEIAKEQQESWEAMPLEAHMAHYESQGIDRKEAMKLVAKDRGVSKRDIYKQLL